jgi:GTP pyrophosphokinase
MKYPSATIQSFFDTLPDIYNPTDREKIQRAYELAAKMHEGQTRASGEPYINHCVSVANILTEMHVHPEVVIAGLLHDTVEDTPLTLADIRAGFKDMAVDTLVNGVTKLSSLPRVTKDTLNQNDKDTPLTPEQISSRKKQLAHETQRKMFMAMTDDPRVILIKLADRLHNMRTLSYTKPEKQKRIAQETLDIFTPLANRLGIWRIKWELEDLSFRYVAPEKYKEIATLLKERRDIREEQIQQIVTAIENVLHKFGLKAEISGRPKHIYSIYKKMVSKNKTFDALTDIRAVRLIVSSIPECYTALGLIHTHWKPITNEFDDYIAVPKENFYQSLHTAVMFDDGQPLEVQIRTKDMHAKAENGIASHWRYKEGGTHDRKYEEYLKNLRAMMDWKEDVRDTTEFLESMHTDVFKDRVYAFTPKGDIMDMPSGSTPIDFAYHVHTDVGHHCRGAKVNGKLVPLDHQLKTGDRVEILTAKHGGPSRDWLNASLGLVATQRARAKIKFWFKKQNRDQNLAQGREMLEKELHRLGLTNVNFEDLARQLSYKNTDDLFVDLGCGDLSISRIVNLLSDQEEITSLEASPTTKPDHSTEAVSVLGLKNIFTQIGKCCNPAPGEPIIGYITRGRGATIHRQDCPNILRTKEKERLVRVSWGESINTFPVPIRVTAYDRQGLMGDISNLLNNEGVNIADVNVKIDHNTLNVALANLKIVVEVRNISQLSRILNRIENLSNVIEATRQRAG